MKNRIYITGMGAITAQGVWRSSFFDEAEVLQQSISRAVQPVYKGLIAPAMIRRMSAGIKMGIYASQQALDDAALAMPDAIITGTGLGCSEDSEKFLRNILDNEEEFLTPTSFIQSTHNTVAAQIALRLGCKGYNFTYVNRSVSFESALLDGMLQLQAAEAENILVGGIDEFSDHTYKLLQLVGHVKQDEQHESVKNSISGGANYAEGSVFFTLSSSKSENAYAELLDVRLKNKLTKEDLQPSIRQFLQENDLEPDQIDALVLGNNGDVEYDAYYGEAASLFHSTPTIYYKHLVGQYDSVSAFGLTVAANVLKEQAIPSLLQWNDAEVKTTLKTILIYNQLHGQNHSLLLVRAC